MFHYNLKFDLLYCVVFGRNPSAIFAMFCSACFNLSEDIMIQNLTLINIDALYWVGACLKLLNFMYYNSISLFSLTLLVFFWLK